MIVGDGYPGELFACLIDAWSETDGVNIIDYDRRLSEAV